MRAFLGTFLGESSQTFYHALVGRVMRAHPDRLRRIPDASAHLTWVFIGELADGRSEAVVSAVGAVAARHRPIPIALGLPRVLSAGPSPRLVCADVTRGAESVRRLADDLAAAMGAVLPDMHLAPMRSAHVTLARFRRQATRGDGRAVAATLSAPAFAGAAPEDCLDRVQLVSSTLAPGGSVYAVVAACPLGA